MSLFPGQLLNKCWQGDVADLYQKGLISGKQELVAAMYHYFRTQDQANYWPWVAPSLHFAKKQQPVHTWLDDFMTQERLHAYSPDLLLTFEKEIIAAVMIAYSPTDYLDYRKSLEFLSKFSQLAGKSHIHLNILPNEGGKDTSTLYLISDEIRLVYAVIGKKGALALDTSAIKSEFPLLKASPYFLHLTASVEQHFISFNAK